MIIKVGELVREMVMISVSHVNYRTVLIGEGYEANTNYLKTH